MKAVILITTYNRPQMCLDLLKDIKSQFECIYKVIVYNDCSTEDYAEVERYLRDNIREYRYERNHKRYGKQKFWELHRKMYREVKKERFDYFIQLLDDTRLVDRFYPDVFDLFHKCGCGVLNIMLPEDLHKRLEATNTIKYKYQEQWFWKKRWIDLCFITQRRFFEKVKWSCPLVAESRWKQNPKASSGVGSALTKAYKGSIALVTRSLLHHFGDESQMNKERDEGRTKTGYKAFV